MHQAGTHEEVAAHLLFRPTHNYTQRRVSGMQGRYEHIQQASTQVAEAETTANAQRLKTNQRIQITADTAVMLLILKAKAKAKDT